MTTRLFTALGFTVFLVLGGCASISNTMETEVSLTFYSSNDFQNATFDTPVTVTRVVSIDPQAPAMDTILRELFEGPTAAEQQAGAVTSEDLRALGPLFLGTSIDAAGVVTVNFSQDALPILNSAAARQFMVKSPIEATLRLLPAVKEVKYAFDGVPFEEWDA